MPPSPSDQQISKPLGAGDLLTLAVFAGLFSGALEGIGYLAAQRMRWLSWDEALLSVGPEQIWVSPVFNLALFLPVAALLIVLKTALRGRLRPGFFIGVFAFLTFFPWMDFTGRIRTSGAAILAMGLAVQVARWLSGHDRAFFGRIRRLLPALAAAVLLYAGGLAGYRHWHESALLTRLPAPRPDARNVVLIVLDTVRPDHLSAYGYARQTSPFLDRLAREGVLFERAYATSSWSLPSHASMMTGRLPSEHGATARGRWRPLDGSVPSLAEALSRQGYNSAGFVANTIWGSPWTGLDHGFARYDCLYGSWADAHARSFYGRTLYRYTPMGRFMRRPASQVTPPVLEWLDAHPKQPFFLFLNFMDAHDPPLAPPPFAGKFTGSPAIPPELDPAAIWKLTPALVRRRDLQVSAYDSAIAYLDQQVSELLDGLRQRGLAGNTLLLVTSDHGEHIGERAIFDHGNSLYDVVLRVPLIVWSPGRVPQGLRVAQPVSLEGLAPTILDIAAMAPQSSFPAASLREFWEGRIPPETPVLAEVDGAPFGRVPKTWPVSRGWVKCIIRGSWKLIVNQSTGAELYDLAGDPAELHNLAAAPERTALVESLRAELGKRIPGARGATSAETPAGAGGNR